MKKYVLIGDANSVHFQKWVNALLPHYRVSIISVTKIIDFNLYPNIEIWSLGIIGNFKLINLMLFIRLGNIINKIKPNFIHVHYLSSYGILLYFTLFFFRFRTAKVIATAWGSDVLIAMRHTFFIRYFVKKLVHKSDFITTDALIVKEYLQKITSKNIQNFVFGLPSMPPFNANKKDLNLYFSNRNLSSNYNIDKVVIHFNSIVKQNKNAKLVIANKGDEMVKLQKLVEHLSLQEAIIFVGFLNANEQNQYYQKAAFYYSIPTSDATSVSLLEAMAHGCMPIVSDIAANNEWITHKLNGYFIENKCDIIYDENFALHNIKIIEEKALFSKIILTYAKQIEL